MYIGMYSIQILSILQYGLEYALICSSISLESPLFSLLSSPSNLTNYFPPSFPLLFLLRPSLIGLPSSSSSSSIPGRAAKKWWKERKSEEPSLPSPPAANGELD